MFYKILIYSFTTFKVQECWHIESLEYWEILSSKPNITDLFNDYIKKQQNLI